MRLQSEKGKEQFYNTIEELATGLFDLLEKTEVEQYNIHNGLERKADLIVKKENINRRFEA